MIRVGKITIHEFRGIRDLTLNLKGANFAVCGPNGTGKSGVVDAIEFALTGNISRLTGAGTGGLSVKQHGPHVDSRNKPEEAFVSLTAIMPSGQEVVVHRTVKSAKAATITPNTPEIQKILGQVALHPEFVLSRRELIRYVLAEPGKRSDEVQALLRLDEIEVVRTRLQRISNAEQKVAEQMKLGKRDAANALLRSLQVSELTKTAVLKGANARRAILSLPPLTVLETTTLLTDGLASLSSEGQPIRVPKAQATTDLKAVRDALAKLESAQFQAAVAEVEAGCTELKADAGLLTHVSRAELLRTALSHFDGDTCPVCDTPWAEDEFKEHVNAKLAAFAEATARRKGLEAKIKPVVAEIFAVRSALDNVRGYGPAFTPAVDVQALKEFSENLKASSDQLEKLLPIETTIGSLATLASVPGNIPPTLDALDKAIAGIPEPTVQDAARDYLVLVHAKFDTYRTASQKAKAAERRAAKAMKVCEVYGTTTAAALDCIYKQVESTFSELYREINKDDESAFTAQLTPSFGKLGFDVDFYGRGHFPPGAYHSEGHQDGMGLCLYLALMSHLMGKGFRFAVLDDVLMSVDSGHRREVCALLKAKFPDTQFILTTHDEIWLRHMKTVGLVQGGASVHFRKWTVDQGPAEWDDRDVWAELQESLDKNEVSSAAATLRHFLEYFAREACHRLRAPVEFRGDHQFMLGDLMPNAISAMGKLFKSGKQAASSWGKKEVADAIADREAEFDEAKKEAQVDQWQVNSAVHYNEWANFQRKDFLPVEAAFRRLVAAMRCEKCEEILYVSPERGPKEALRCRCGEVNISLIAK